MLIVQAISDSGITLLGSWLIYTGDMHCLMLVKLDTKTVFLSLGSGALFTPL